MSTAKKYKFETLQLHVGQEQPDPATTTHSQLTDSELQDQGIGQNTIRLSIGTEHIDDIIADLEQGFNAVKAL